MAIMSTLPHTHIQDPHEVARNKVLYDNESGKIAANCEHLTMRQNDEESNDDHCNLKEADEFCEESSKRRILHW